MRRTHPALIAAAVALAVAVVALAGYILVGLGDDSDPEPAAASAAQTHDAATLNACAKADAAAEDEADPPKFLLGARAAHRAAAASGDESLRALAGRLGTVEDDAAAAALVSAVQEWCTTHGAVG